jgi:hypothetical protein
VTRPAFNLNAACAHAATRLQTSLNRSVAQHRVQIARRVAAVAAALQRKERA